MFRIDSFTPAPPREQVRRPFKNIDPSSLSFNVPQPTFCIVHSIESLAPVLLWILTSLPPLDGFAWYRITRMTRMTDWRTRITTPHPICHHNHPESFMCWYDFCGTWNTSGIQAIFSFNVHRLCTAQTTVCVNSTDNFAIRMKVGKLQLWIQSCYTCHLPGPVIGF